MSRWWMLLALFSLTLAPITAQEEEDLDDEAELSEPTLSLPLPNRDSAGRPLWPIGVYQSQLVDVIPKHFRAVAIGELREALNRSGIGQRDAYECRVVSAFYDVRVVSGVMESARSEFSVAHRGVGVKDALLGDVNLAIHRGTDTTGVGKTSRVPRLEVDESGMLHAITASNTEPINEAGAASAAESVVTKIPFAWSLRGETNDNSTVYELRIPRASQTRMIFSTPMGIRLRSRQGVLIERPSPPPDADLQNRNSESRWYVLEAGGLNRIELTAVPESNREEDSLLLVRRESKQYEVDLSGVTWTHRLSVESVQPLEKIRLRCATGMVASVRADSFRVEPKRVDSMNGTTTFEVELPNSSPTGSTGGDSADRAESPFAPIVLTVTGNSDWDLATGLCPLPSVEIDAPRVIRCEPETQAVITVLDSISVDDWLLPNGWTQTEQGPGQLDETLLLARGPPAGSVGNSGAWAELRLSAQSPLLFDPTLVRLDVEQTPSPTLRARARVRCQRMEPIVPIRMELEPGWSIADVTVIGSGRKVTHDGGRDLEVWPNESEVTDGAFGVEITAQRALVAAPQRFSVPSIWLARPLKQVTPQVTAIQPPKRRRWDGSTVMLGERLTQADLSADQAGFLQPDSDTLLIGRSTAGSVVASLEPTRVSYDVNVRHALESNNGRVSETIVVRTDAPSSIPTLTIQAGRMDEDRSKFRWSLRKVDGSGVVSISDSRVSVSADADTQTYSIGLDDRDLGEYELFGRRSYEPTGTMRVVLPSVRGATSQTAETQLSRDWDVVELPASVQLVPADSESAEDEIQRLRYDSTDWQAIMIEPSSRRTKTCLVWSQTLSVVASCRGQDVFQLSALISSQSPAFVTFDPDLELISVRRNGISLPVNKVRGRRLRIDPEFQTDQIAVTLIRRHSSSEWLRRCEAPQIAIDGHVLSGTVTCQSDAESLLLPSIFGEPAMHGAAWMLVPRNVCLAIGWLACGFLFTLAWFVARVSVWGIRGLFLGAALSVGASIIWWPYQQALIAWVAMPFGLAGLIYSAHAGSKSKDRSLGTKAPKRDRSVDFSFNRTVWLPITFAIGLSGNSLAQVIEGASERPAPAPIALLVPMNEDHERVGDKVYVAEEDYQEIVSRSDPARPVAARIQNAEYRVFLEADREAETGISSRVEADYEVQLNRRATNLRLPVGAQWVRRVELVGDDQRRILRHTVNAGGTINVGVPPGDFFRLRVSLQPTIRSSEVADESRRTPESPSGETSEPRATAGSSVVQLSIPVVHSARVVVEAPREVVVESLGETVGRAVNEADVARYSADLGPIDQLSVSCRSSARSGTESVQSARRTYRVSVGWEEAFVECEIVPARKLRRGDSVDLIVIGDGPMSVTSPSWTMQRVSDENIPTDAAQTQSATYRFTKQSRSNAPIRLVWTTRLKNSASGEGMFVEIPEVLTGPASRPEYTLFGFETEKRVQRIESAGARVVSSDVFADVWLGHRGSIGECFRANGEFPKFTIVHEKSPPVTVDAEQRLHISDSKMSLEFRGELTDRGATARRLMLDAPHGFQMIQCEVNGERVGLHGITRSGNQLRLPLGDQRIDGKVTIIAIAELDRSRSAVVQLPRFKINQNGVGEERYFISHDPRTVIKWNAGDLGAATDWERTAISDAELMGGRIPFAAKLTPSNEAIVSSESLNLSTRSGTRFRCSQTSTMAYSAGRWVCRTELAIPANQCPPYIDVEMPTRWATDLGVAGSETWVTRASSDGSVTVVRLALDVGDQSGKRPVKFLIEGFLDQRDQARVSVPSIKVLGNGARERLVVVPNRLTAEPIAWRSGGGARSVSNRNARREPLPELDFDATTLYEVTGTNWSIDLEPLSQASEEPAATIADARVILEADKALVLQRFDLAPETQNQVTIKIPGDALLLGVWSAGREVDVSGLREGELVVPLAYSRLGQSLEVLLTVDVGVLEVRDYLPSLRDVPVSSQWVAYYSTMLDAYSTRADLVSPTRRGSAEGEWQQTGEWRLELAKSIVAVIDRSRDTLADRSSDEVRQWLRPWLSRFQQLALVSGAQIGSAETPDAAPIGENQADWMALYGSLVDAIGDQSEPSSVAVDALFDEDRFSGYELKRVMRVNDEAGQNLPALQLSYPKASPVRRYLLDALTLLMMAFVFVLAWPFRGQFADRIQSPFVWASLVALLMLFLAPALVSLSLLASILVPIMVMNADAIWRLLSPRSSRPPTP